MVGMIIVGTNLVTSQGDYSAEVKRFREGGQHHHMLKGGL